MAYVPSADELTQPTTDKPVLSAAEEFRTLKAKVARALLVPEAGELPDFPAVAVRAGKIAAFDGLGNPAVLDGSTVPVGSATALALLLLSSLAGEGADMITFEPDNQGLTVGRVAYAVAHGGVTPGMYGALANGTNQLTALQDWANSPYPKQGDGKTYTISGTLNLPVNANIDFRGMKIQGGQVLITGSLTALPNLSASPSAGAISLSFVTDHGLAERDVFIIYNPTNSSWSTKQAYYRAGEYCKVAFVSSTTAVKVWNRLYAGYTAANVTVHKITQNEVCLRNLTVIGPNTGTASALKIRLATKVRLSNVVTSGTDYSGINLDRCFDVEIDGCEVQVPVQGAASKYGVSVGNCQHVRIRGGMFYSVRHTVNIGGDDFTGAVPNRDVKVTDGFHANDSALSNVSCLDIHGNSQDIWYMRNTVIGGGSFGGRDNHYIDNNFLGADLSVSAIMYGGSEWMGGVAEVIGGYIENGAAYTNGTIRIANSTDSTLDTQLIVRGVSVRQGTCDTFARCDVGNAAYKISASIRDIDFLDGAPSLANVLRCVGTGAAGDGDFVIVDDLTNVKSGASLYIAASGYGAAVKCRLQTQTTKLTLTPVAAAALVAGTWTFRNAYGSKIPHITIGHTPRTINSKLLNISYRLLSATAVTIDASTDDLANFGVTTPDIEVTITAGLAEI